MRSRLHTHQKNTRIPTPEPSTAPAGGMFQPRPFGKPSPTADAYQQPDLKTSLMQAERYGHHLNQMHDTDVSPPQVTQPKMGSGWSMHSEPAAQLKSQQVQPSSGGRPLPEAVQQKMEAAFRTDFSNVRVHEGAQAKSMGADAYAQGNQIHFQPGKYNPMSQSGQQLLGHELTHVVQQRAGQVAVPQGKGAPINSDPKLEQEADILGAKAAQGKQAQVAGAGSGIQRQATSPLAHNSTPAVQLRRGRGGRKRPASKPAAQGPASKPAAQGPASKPAAQGPASKPAAQGPASQGPASQGPTSQGPASKPAAQGPTSQGPASQGPASKPAAQEPASQGPASKPAAQEPASKRPSIRDLANKGSNIQDLANKGSSIRDLASQGSSIRDLASQGSSIRDLASQGSTSQVLGSPGMTGPSLAEPQSTKEFTSHNRKDDDSKDDTKHDPSLLEKMKKKAGNMSLF